MLFPLVDGALSPLRHNVFVTTASPEWHVLPLVIFFFILPKGRRASFSQLGKKVGVRTCVIISSKQHEMIVIVRRREHDMLNVTALPQRRRRLVKMGKLEIPDLNNTRQSHAFLINIFRTRSRTRLTRDHLHSVGRLNCIEMRNVVKVEKPAPPRSVAGVATMEHGEMHRIDAVLNEVEPVVIVVANQLDISLAATVDKRRIFRNWRRRIPVRSHVGEDESTQFPHRIRKVLDLPVILAAFWLPGLLETIARYVEQPPVVGAPNASLFDVSVFEGAAAVRAMQAHKTDVSF